MKKVLLILNLLLCVSLYGQDESSKFFFSASLGLSDALNKTKSQNQPYGLDTYQNLHSPKFFSSIGIEYRLNRRFFMTTDFSARKLFDRYFGTKLEGTKNNNIITTPKSANLYFRTWTVGVSTQVSYHNIILRPKFSIGALQNNYVYYRYTTRPINSNYFTNVTVTSKSPPNLYVNLDFDLTHQKLEYHSLNIGIGYGRASNRYKIVSTTFNDIETTDFYESVFSKIFLSFSIKARIGNNSFTD